MPESRTQAHFRTDLRGRAAEVSERVITVLSAPGGSGKTTLARSWQAALIEDGQPCGWLSLTESHGDLELFVLDLIPALRVGIRSRETGAGDVEAPRFGESIDRLVQLRHELDEAQVLRRLRIELAALDSPPVVVVDSYEHLPRDSAPSRIVDRLLSVSPCPIRILLTTRGRTPDGFVSLLASGEGEMLERGELDLRAAQVAEVLRDHGVEPDGEVVSGLVARTGGWAIAVQLMARTLAGTAAADRLERVRGLGGQEDLFDYIGRDLVGQASPDAREIVETSARLGSASRETLLLAADPDFDRTRGLEEALDGGLLIRDEGQLVLHDMWLEWFGARRAGSNERDDEAPRRLRMARALEDGGQADRAIGQYRAALPMPGALEGVMRVLAERGQEWLHAGRRSEVEKSLAVLPSAAIHDEPRLSAIEGLFLSGSDPDRAIEHFERACQAYREAGQAEAEGTCLHELGILAINENRVDVLKRVRGRTLSMVRSIKRTPLRGLGLTALGFAAMTRRRPNLAIRLLDAARTYDHHPREYGGIALVQAGILLDLGRWTDLLRRIDEALARREQRMHGSSYAVLLVYKSMVESALGGDAAALELRFEEARDFLALCRHTHNVIRAELAYAQHLSRHGELTRALERLRAAEAHARRIELREAVASSLGSQARYRQRIGDSEGALATARDALSGMEDPNAPQGPSGFVHPFVPGILLACWVLACEGEPADALRARDFLARHGSLLHLPQAPVIEHMTGLVRARVARATGDGRAGARLEREAWSLAERARFEGFSVDLDPALLRSFAGEAHAAGIEGDAVSRAFELTGGRPDPVDRVRTLGALQLVIDGRPVPERAWRGRNTKRLLLRLLSAGSHAVAREKVQSDLWPNARGTLARASLRTTLSRLRDVLEPRRRRTPDRSLLHVDGQGLRLDSLLLDGWDVGRLELALREAEASLEEDGIESCRRAYEKIERIPVGPFAVEFEDVWLQETRSAIERELLDRARALGNAALKRRAPDLARRIARWSLGWDPADEGFWSLIVRAAMQEGDFEGARRTLAEAREALARSGTAPFEAPDLQQLADSL